MSAAAEVQKFLDRFSPDVIARARHLAERKCVRVERLSHDLIEGAHMRVGMASDIQLLEDFPSGYDAFIQRQHRWVRGDWQISAWLFPFTPGGRNALPLIERWKIFDNLRQSLAPPALVLRLL